MSAGNAKGALHWKLMIFRYFWGFAFLHVGNMMYDVRQ